MIGFSVLAFSISIAVISFSRYDNWLDTCAFEKAKAEAEIKAAAEKAADDAKVAILHDYLSLQLGV
jgi:hypothetical protein